MDLIHSQTVKLLLCVAGLILMPPWAPGEEPDRRSSSVEQRDKDSNDYFRETIDEWLQKIDQYREDGLPTQRLEEAVKAMRAARQLRMAEDRLGEAGLLWFDSPQYWSLKSKLIKQTATEVLVEVTTTNLSDGPRGVYSEEPNTLYRLVWTGNQPVALFDPAKLPERRKAVSQYFLESGETKVDTVNLAEFAKLEDGLTYTVEFRRVLDFAGLNPRFSTLKCSHWVAAEPITFVRRSKPTLSIWERIRRVF